MKYIVHYHAPAYDQHSLGPGQDWGETVEREIAVEAQSAEDAVRKVKEDKNRIIDSVELLVE